ncbi:FixH family protein [Flavobacterium difficile]|uniref:Cytochrome C oxidase Cbb3 n=1 Tax=Flavobacterium difficile TaxID=2709659 RepID=A0ABX0I2Q5_9FLAO|nr:FixH family protein [Flavobacterium difficile]NHM01461.1 cytochrome C oxidase Cbb3 [Flavobacterium difficile]
MKINWGTGVVIGFGSFMTFILFFVFLVQSNSKYDNELVADDYYKQESNVQRDIESQTLSNALKTKLKIEKTAEGIQIIFPAAIDYKNINGTISLYRPSNQKLDFETKISLSSPIMLIPKHKLIGGLWEISINWKVEELTYLNKETVYF